MALKLVDALVLGPVRRTPQCGAALELLREIAFRKPLWQHPAQELALLGHLHRLLKGGGQGLKPQSLGFGGIEQVAVTGGCKTMCCSMPSNPAARIRPMARYGLQAGLRAAQLHAAVVALDHGMRTSWLRF